MDEHLQSTQAMQFSPFKEPFKDELDEWNNDLKVFFFISIQLKKNLKILIINNNS